MNCTHLLPQHSRCKKDVGYKLDRSQSSQKGLSSKTCMTAAMLDSPLRMFVVVSQCLGAVGTTVDRVHPEGA